jgi:C4-type Zn-finger protein
MSKNMIFERTWCDYLTPCPYINNIEIGSYECSTCGYFDGVVGQESMKPGDYFSVVKGCIRCSL